MIRQLAGLLLSLACGVAVAEVRLAIIIDDVGYDYAAAQQVLELPREITVSILPRLAYSTRVAKQAHGQGREVMLHQPMQSIYRHKALGPGGMDRSHTRPDMVSVLAANLESVPHVAGVNNHMGSMLTQNLDSMRWLMAALKQRGDMYFEDSRTDVRTRAEEVARDNGVTSARRDVFLDHDKDPEAIRAQAARLLELARSRGSAIAIGHPYPETLAVLRELLPQWREQGVVLLPVSQLIAHQRSPGSWHASSSPLPKVAKNSKR